MEDINVFLNKARLEYYASTNIWAFTDGGALNNGKPGCVASWGFVVVNGKTSRIMKEDSGILLEGATNNRGEYTAILKLLQYLVKTDIPAINIASDSLLAIKTLTIWYANWVEQGTLHEKKNTDIIAEIYDLTKKIHINWRHVRSHTKEPSDPNERFFWFYNDRADVLCSRALKEFSKGPRVLC